MLKLQLPVICNLPYIVFYTDKDKAEKTFLFGYFKVMRADGSIISDGHHKLFVYKVCVCVCVCACACVHLCVQEIV